MSVSKDEIRAYLENRMTVGEEVLKAMTLYPQGGKLPTRSVFLVIDKYIRDFQSGRSTEPRWVAIPGLRGVGKTTLIAQLYNKINCKKFHKIYISLDEASRTLGVSINEILNVYEKMLETSFEKLDDPVFIFLDEVQYDPSWGVTLKIIRDKAPKIFFVCTGSSALSLQTNPDVARRLSYAKLYPLNFTEYQMIKERIYPIRELGNKIRKAIFYSQTAEEAYKGLKEIESEANKYWARVKDADIDTYMKFGSLPFTIAIKQEPLIYSQINQTLNSVLNKDVPQLNTFTKETIDRLSQVLYSVASYEGTSFLTVSQTVGLDIKTVISIFEALEKTELLLRIYPYGPPESQVRKPSKYLFTAPAFRAMYYNLVGSTTSFTEYKGKIFEDVVGLYLHRIFSMITGSNITYDSAKGGADFIVGTTVADVGNIVIEASLGQKNYKQLFTTMKKTKAKYGVVISDDPIRLSQSKTAISVPLKIFLLI
ncbi:MAG: AAA family ATPase [Patescibacteria group bacterium]